MADAMSGASGTVSAQQTPCHPPLSGLANSELYISDKSVKCAFPSGSCEEDQEYVLQCVCSDEGNRIAVALSTKSVKVYDAITLEIKAHLKGHNSTVNDIAFLPNNEDVLFTASSDGSVRVWNIARAECTAIITIPRKFTLTNEETDEFDSVPPRKKEQLLHTRTPEATCLSPNKEGELLAAGVGSSILFYDIRKIDETNKLPLGAYVESHQTRVSELRFHPTLPQYLLSGSEDNLVNVFDVSQPTEEDALNGVINAGSAVRHFGFFGPENAFVWIQTNCNSLSLWNVGSTLCVGNYRWLPGSLNDKGFKVDHLVTCSYIENSQALILICGTDSGEISAFKVLPEDIEYVGKMTRSVHNSGIRCGCWAKSIGFTHVNGFELPNAALYTGAEDGTLVRWVPCDGSVSSPSSSRKGRVLNGGTRGIEKPGTKPY